MMDFEREPKPDLFSSAPAFISDFIELMKPRLVGLSIFSTFVGFYLAAPSGMNLSLLFAVLTGSALVAGASMVLNQWMERDTDCLMVRTAKRPIPTRRVTPVEALVFGIVLAGLGLSILEMAVNSLASFFAAMTLMSYLFLYTPLKKITPYSTLVGALPGALPPLIGWAAAGDIAAPGAWIIFSILFLWQMPHFYAIAWIYREEYAAAGLKVFPVIYPSAVELSKQSLFYALVLVPVSLLPTAVGLTGALYFFGALALGVCLLVIIGYSFRTMDQGARYLFRASVIYLTLLFLLMIVDKA